MIEIDLASSFVVKDDQLPVRIAHPQVLAFSQIQIEIFDAGVSNPSPQLGFGAAPDRCGDNLVQALIDARHLKLGVYEIRLIRFHTPTREGVDQQLDFVPLRDFARVIFEVVAQGSEGRSAAALLATVTQSETALEQEFLRPVEVGDPTVPTKAEVTALVFVRDVLIGTAVRFRNFELIPTGSGLDSKDSLEFVNTFLKERTRTGLTFPYDDAARQSSRSSAPVCVVHFPTLVGSTREQVRDHCLDQVQALLLALSLSRDAGGAIFEVVLIDRTGGQSIKYSVSSPYVDNLLTGDLSGESALTLETYLLGLENDPMTSFLVSLYKQARREPNADYQYLRFWQILEVMADTKNYDPEQSLLDYEGDVMLDGAQTRKCSGSVNTVFALLRDEALGTTTGTWERVNVWFAFRSAVAHHGDIVHFEKLSRENVKKWARQALQEISQAGHDQYLWDLKEDVKLMLMRRLVRSAAANERAGT